MAIADPKDYAKTAEKTPTPPTMEQLMLRQQELEARRLEIEEERLRLDRERHAGEQDRQQREMPENKVDPGHSVYNMRDGQFLPPGERPELRCKTFLCGRELLSDVETVEEIELYNRLVPGEFRVTKADGSTIPFKVSIAKTESGKIDRVDIWFPCNKEHKHNHMPITSYLKQALGEKRLSNEEMQAELQRLQNELARARTGVMSAV